ncbi:hypothetical protein HRbin22_00947 [Candidatus Thermoflexus japonica]|uniref:DUF4179 domain-containing protein n=1 Tax=Candidatus Thermoflexus japonica TaxID=2035417 RepID=A0A2H5Y5I8_9CHLR|nr:hypothetical protein HRbin22_00947 [Candidatus Thermoflexus japonica]
MDERELRRMLEELAEEGFPEPVGLWPRLRTRIEASSHATAVGQWIRRPLAWGLALLMLAIGIGTGAYAGGLWRAFLLAREPMGSSLATPLGLQQERDGYRITLEWAYADWNSIRIGYRIQGPSEPQQRVEIPAIRLQDEAGRLFSPEVQEGLVGASEQLGFALPPGEQAFVTAFDTWGHEPLPDPLRLQLTFQLQTALDPQPGGNPSGFRQAIGPFVFSFTIPVRPGYVLRGPRSAMANGVTVTLERLVAAPSGVKARLCAAPLDPQRSWSMIPVLRPDPHTAFPGGVRREGEACFRAFFPVGVTDLRLSEGSLQVMELIGWDPSGRTEPLRLPGPWRIALAPEP